MNKQYVRGLFGFNEKLHNELSLKSLEYWVRILDYKGRLTTQMSIGEQHGQHAR